ncbi:secretion/conjugation apparatus DotM-related subunit [Kozakia baliensis]|uniref:DotM C-terminal cytoplasmic domain-containing protein n=2 Tax=Kozakia baliensis TaxID=153496 RepID=A0A1D8UXH1_9PROT|nr:hypothetical protein [Kozakia baliensis]AOX18408.1 hypothetical protein A0U89_13895 [Kozakia baliensis]GEL65152.1 hypothetical protein KBA01_24380 [Kozakia baliensis]
MSSGRTPWSSSDDYLLFSTIAIVLGSAALAYVVWMTWHAQIAAFYIRVLMAQVHALHSRDPALIQLQQQLAAASVRPDLVRAIQLYYGLAIFGHALRWPAALLIAGLGVVCMVRAAPGRFAKALDLEGLIGAQAQMFPALRGFAQRKLTKLVAPAAGAPRPADPALNLAEWRERFATDRHKRFSESGAIAALTAQLGRHWTGLDAASPVERVLFAAFYLHHQQKRADAMALLGDLSESLSQSGLDGPEGPASALDVSDAVRAKADIVLCETGARRTIDAVCERHGWTVTALMTLLNEARRRSGVLAPPAFAIVKLIDRPLWYALHALGFPTERPDEEIHPNPRVEAAGARAHWEAERRAKRPLYTPALDAALHTIRPA